MSMQHKISVEDDLFTPGAFDLECDPSEGLDSKLKALVNSLQVPDREQAERFVTYCGQVSLSLKPIPEVLEYIRQGFDPGEINFTSTLLALTQKSLAESIGVSQRTLQRKVQDKKRLSREESDRLFRIQKVSSAALDLFEGNVEAMRRWLKAPLPALGGETPLAYSDTDPGARFVLDLINRLEHGVFS